MSVKAMAWAWSIEGLKNPSEVVVLMALADSANDKTNLSWLGVAELAKRSRMHKRNVQRVLTRLIDGGFIRVSSRFSQSGRQRSNLYELAVNGLFVSEQETPQTGEGDNLSPYETSHSHQGGNLSPLQNPATTQDDKLSPLPEHDFWGEGGACAMGEGGACATPISLNPKIEPPNQTPQPPALASAPAPHEVRSAQQPAALTEADWDLLTKALPEAMRFVDATGAQLLIPSLYELLGRGWQPWQIRRTLNANPLPDRVISLTGLVRHRLETLKTTPAPPLRRQEPNPLTEVPQDAPVPLAACLRLRELAAQRHGLDKIRPRSWWIGQYGHLSELPNPTEREHIMATAVKAS